MTDRVLLEAHAHTKETSPCGWLSGEELVEELAAKGYGAVVITDHYTPGERNDAASRDAFLDGWRAAKVAGDRLGVTVLPGMEIRFKDRKEEFLVYGMEEEDFASLPDNACEMGLSSFHEIAQAHGWRVYQAHPFRKGHYAANPAFMEGVESFNGNPRHDSQNRPAANFATLNSMHTIAGTDVHRHGDVGIVGLLVPGEAISPKGFAEWLAATPHPKPQYQEAPVNGIRYLVGAIPSEDMLKGLYNDAGWTSYTQDMEESMNGIHASLRFVTAWDDTVLVGMARAVGDEYTVLYVQDILVSGTYHRRGIGRELMRRLLLPYRNVRQTVLITDDTTQTRAFYRACGFEDVADYHCSGFIRLR